MATEKAMLTFEQPSRQTGRVTRVCRLLGIQDGREEAE